MTEDMSKYGFFIVICVPLEGHRSLVYTYDEQFDEHSAQFKTEKEAVQFKEFAEKTAKDRGDKVVYYHKYVSWNLYD